MSDICFARVNFSQSEKLVGPSGLEPPTSCLSGTRSNHLSYEPLSGGGPVAVLRLYFAVSFPLPRPFYRSRLEKACGFFTFYGCTPLCAGGDDGIRTHDPLLAGQVLSQLSYTPIYRVLLFLRELCLTNYSLFIIHHSLFISKRSLLGRPKWTRTTDLVLIRHAL